MNKNHVKRAITAIEKIQKLYRNPEKWTQHAMARDKYGIGVAAKSPKACSWCLDGAALKFTAAEPISRLVEKTLEDTSIEFNNRGFVNFNDEAKTRIKDVRKLLSAAKRSLKKEL